jgi:CubicO group peptidase (beta-lactamase class C family)
MPSHPFAAAHAILDGAVAERAFPAAVAEVGRSAGAVWQTAAGTLDGTPESTAASLDTVFDLASLTKVIATTSIVMRLVEQGRVHLDDPLARWLADWRGSDRATVTIADLLTHSSGLTGHLPLYRDAEGRAAFEDAICRLPLEYAPRTRSVYSDLGFILLAFLVEHAASAPIDVLFEAAAERIRTAPLTFRPPRDWLARTAPTGLDRWRGRVLVGEVHDRNAWALGGVAGHAGLFGTAAAVGAFAQLVLRGLRGIDSIASPSTMRRFATRTGVPGSSRALGWDTMRPTSSCGTRMHATAIGHTGFTGTSLWIDWEADVYAVLLTNRVHPSAGNDAILAVRPVFHDAIMDAMAGGADAGRVL